ncbi:MarR family transcriptional regulator [uncultured Roseobacter sp.]|uniref:MarR family winged helix-turn-helix transcriptional regulator n=1 Tax=uncultured Roseobacter sp. TaxID=114847 RepID=UPI0026072021|nr:MarR family transcriptional regulator [uncultured Roseobacter sp.]
MSDTKEASAPILSEQLCFALYSTSRAITKAYASLLDDLGLTYPQYIVMLVLWEGDGLSPRELSRRLEIDRATMTPLIQRLEKMDLVRKTRDRADDRMLQVFLTDAGDVMRRQVFDMPERLGCALGISEQDAEILLRDVKRLRASIG